MEQAYYVGRDVMGNPIVIPTGLAAGNVIAGQVAYGATVNGQTNASTLNDYANQLNELSVLHQTLLVSGQLVSTGTGDDLASALPTATVKKPWLDAPDGAVTFDNAAAQPLPAVAGSVVVVTHTVPEGYDGVINQFSWNFTGGGFVQGSGDLQAQLLRNGIPIRNYENMLVEKGTIGIARAISPLRVYSNDIISLVVNHLVNGLLNGNVVASLVGYDYPSMS